MKRTLYFIPALAAALCLGSCGKFLEEVSPDQIVPKSVTDFSEFIYGEVYFKHNDINSGANGQTHTFLDIMTDDVEDFAKTATLGTDTRIEGFGYYTWQSDPELRREGTVNNDTAWAHYYHQILMCNITLYGLPDAEGTAAERALLSAECHMIRAYAYWKLVNLYGEPYRPETAATAMGVPINDLVSSQDKTFDRSSVEAVYAQITSDIRAAMEQFAIGGPGKSLYRWNIHAARVFASRVALYMHDWDGAVRYASDAIAERSRLWNLEQKKGVLPAQFFFCRENPEILFSFGYSHIPYFATAAKGAFPASAALKAMFPAGDLRYGANDGMFVRNQGQTLSMFGGGKRYVQFKYGDPDLSGTGMFGSAIRTAEALLNRAEAYAQRPGDLDKAIADLNTLRRERITAATYADLPESTDQQVVLKAVRDERRRELCFEQHRWFDLRRWGCPSITHVIADGLGASAPLMTYVLEENDPAYTLPVPQRVRALDDRLGNPERPRREPVQ